MANDTKRNVEVNLKILNDKDSQENLAKINKSLDDMAKSMRSNVKGVGDLASATKNLGRMEREARRQWTTGENREDLISRQRSGGVYGGPGAGSGALAARLMGGAAAAFAAAPAIARAGHDSFMTSGQKGRALVRDLIPFGGRIQNYVDSFSGRAAGMERANLESGIEGTREDALTRLQSQRLGMNPQLASQRSLAQSLGRANPILIGGIDRSTSAGEREFRERSRLVPIERDIAKNQREATAATQARLAAESEMNRIVTRGNKLTTERAELQEKIRRDDGSGVSRQIMLNRLGVVNEAIESNRGQREQAWQSVYGARTAEGQAKGATALARSQYQAERAGILEERAGTAAGMASNFGMMNPFDRTRSVEAFKMLQQSKGDTAMLPPDMLQLAMSAGGPAAQKLVEGFGARTGEFQAMKKLAPDVYSGDPEQLRREAAQARDEAERMNLAAQAEIAKTVAKAGENFGDMIGKMFTEFLQNAETRIRNDMSKGKNAP